MKVLGLIVELNPFHNGHKYFIDEAIKKVQPDVVIAISSSSFTMRGEAMVMDKWEKTKIVLNYGIDIFVELPFISGVANADYFCYNAIAILNMLQITDLAFGVELADIDKLNTLLDITTSQSFNNIVKKNLDNGHSYATSHVKALKELGLDEEMILNYSLPNNTLALGYLKSIKKINPNIKPTIIKRIKNNYYDEKIIDGKINSATAIRNLLSLGQSIKTYTPPIDYPYFNPLLLQNNLFYLVKYYLYMHSPNQLQKFYGVNEGIENRLYTFIDKATNYAEFIELVKSKRYSANRIRRLLLYILLEIPKEYEQQYMHYLRILGMNSLGEKYINTIPKNIKKEIITTFKNQNNELVNIELKASKLYTLITNKPYLYLQEFSIPYIGARNNE